MPASRWAARSCSIPARDCDDWHGDVGAVFLDTLRRRPPCLSPGATRSDCGERDWYVALLDHPHYVHGIFTAYFTAAGGRFAGAVREGRAPPRAKPFATLESPPLYDIVRDVNKLSNNVMARQMFLTLVGGVAAVAGDAAEIGGGDQALAGARRSCRCPSS